MAMGMWVQGDDFYGRTEELGALFDVLERDNASLLAPRRVGKTSLMHRAVEAAPLRGWTAVFVDVQGASDELGLLARLIAALHEANHPAERSWGRWLQGRIGALRGGASQVKVELPAPAGASLGAVQVALREVPPASWRELAQELASRLAGHPVRTVILIDELPVLVLKLLDQPDGKRRAADLLDWHRELRVAPNATHLRWVLGGSIGIATVAQQHNLTSRFNDLAPLDLGAFDDDEAHGFLVHLSARLGDGACFPPDVRDYLIGRIGWAIPYYLRLLAEPLSRAGAGREVNRVDVDLAFDHVLAPSRRGLHFDHWVQRLAEQLAPPLDGDAKRMLLRCALDPDGTERGALIRDLPPDRRDEDGAFLLDVLESDGYLVHDGRRFRFRSPLLREFWLRRFGVDA